MDIGTVDRIRRGLITVRPGIARMSGADVHFDDGARAPFDVIIQATGYRPKFCALSCPIIRMCSIVPGAYRVRAPDPASRPVLLRPYRGRDRPVARDGGRGRSESRRRFARAHLENSIDA